VELSQAKQIINSAIDIAIQKGCYSLGDVQAVIQALEKINSVDDIEFTVNE
jgi:hypothetical protein